MLSSSAHSCTCAGGTAAVATDGSCDVNGAEDCTACDAGYTLNGQVCDGLISAQFIDMTSCPMVTAARSSEDNLTSPAVGVAALCGHGSGPELFISRDDPASAAHDPNLHVL